MKIKGWILLIITTALASICHAQIRLELGAGYQIQSSYYRAANDYLSSLFAQGLKPEGHLYFVPSYQLGVHFEVNKSFTIGGNVSFSQIETNVSCKEFNPVSNFYSSRTKITLSRYQQWAIMAKAGLRLWQYRGYNTMLQGGLGLSLITKPTYVSDNEGYGMRYQDSLFALVSFTQVKLPKMQVMPSLSFGFKQYFPVSPQLEGFLSCEYLYTIGRYASNEYQVTFTDNGIVPNQESYWYARPSYGMLQVSLGLSYDIKKHRQSRVSEMLVP